MSEGIYVIEDPTYGPFVLVQDADTPPEGPPGGRDHRAFGPAPPGNRLFLPVFTTREAAEANLTSRGLRSRGMRVGGPLGVRAAIDLAGACQKKRVREFCVDPGPTRTDDIVVHPIEDLHRARQLEKA